MPRIISLDEKLAVIEDWLNGESRNNIAIRRNIGNGTVYNIVQEWTNEVGIQRANRLRVIAIKLKKNGLTVSDCAKGLRMLMIFKKYGIKDDEDQEKVIYFLKEVYTKCQEVGLTSNQVFDYIGDILKFSTEISISEIPKFIKKRIEEKEKLESEVEQLSRKKNELTEIKEEVEQEIQGLKNNKETMSETYKTFTITKFRLKQYGIQMEDLDHFVNCVVGISKENYNPVQTVTKIADYEKLEQEIKLYKSEVSLKKDQLIQLNQDIDAQKNTLNYFNIKIDILNELEIRGFGINELRTLISMLNEIGLENNQDFDETKKNFFDDVKNYEEVIRSRKEIDRLKNERKRLEVQVMREREKYNSYPKIIESIIRMIGAGISEEDIVNIDKILLMTDYYLYKDNQQYKEALFDDLQKYRDLKLAIKNLEDRKEQLRSIQKIQNKPTKKKGKNVYRTKRKESVN
ncbi:MAG: hypothetical protein ACRD6U_04480 [Nitrososphaeraceae archaeon]